MIKGLRLYSSLMVCTIILFAVACRNNYAQRFDKAYNPVRKIYGSPVIHDYMELALDGDTSRKWSTPNAIQDTITKGFHADKVMYVYPDSVLSEDDWFRKRLSDSTFAFLEISTYGNPHTRKFTSILYDTVCASELGLECHGKRCITGVNPFAKDLNIKQADSILASWGTSRSQ